MDSSDSRQVIAALQAQTKALEEIARKLGRLAELQHLQLNPEQKKELQQAGLAKRSGSVKQS